MELDEPSREEIMKVVKTIDLIFGACESDPIFSGGVALMEAVHGNGVADELKQWVKDPLEKRGLRNELVQKIARLWGE